LEPIRTYLNKHAPGDSLIVSDPEIGLKYIVVIPSYLETRLEESLVSLFDASHPSLPVEVIVVINWPEDESQENIRLSRETVLTTKVWARQHSSEKKQFHVITAGFIPRKKAGVGFARKTGLDEAVRRFQRAGQENGILISFDADTLCEANYLKSIEKHFLLNPSADGCSIYFEHPMEGNSYKPEVYKAIIQYELHMRCYLHAIRHGGFPHAFYTVGSAFAVRANSYCRQGGMNTRKAGEDFYFLQKFFDLGNFTDLLSTSIAPSPRPSLRVPFGTGKAIDQLLKSSDSLKSYNPETYNILAGFHALVPLMHEQIKISGNADLQGLHPCMKEFLAELNFEKEVLEIYRNSGSREAFVKRVHRYFNMFRILKFAKHARNSFHDLPVAFCAKTIMETTGMKVSNEMSEKDMLLEFRRKDKGLSGQQ